MRICWARPAPSMACGSQPVTGEVELGYESRRAARHAITLAAADGPDPVGIKAAMAVPELQEQLQDLGECGSMHPMPCRTWITVTRRPSSSTELYLPRNCGIRCRRFHAMKERTTTVRAVNDCWRSDFMCPCAPLCEGEIPSVNLIPSVKKSWIWGKPCRQGRRTRYQLQAT